MGLFTKSRRRKRKGRWGKKFVDERDWKAYDENLVVRGEFLLDVDWVNSWDDELCEMNNGKRGAPYLFPNSLIELQAVWHQWVDYRGIEGIARKLAGYGLIPDFNDYSTINRRVNKLHLGFKLPKSGSVMVSTDGSGMKMTNRGEYRKDKYGIETKKYVHVIISADPVKKELLECDVFIDEKGVSEPEIAEEHMEKIIEKGLEIGKFWGDGKFYTKKLFNFCQKHNIETAIKIREDASTNSRGSLRKAREVKEYKKKGYKKWAKDKKYGQRWTGTEGMFSVVKRKFGEEIRSRRIWNILHEAKSKFWAYQKMKNYASVRI